jgi:hypothetical protein
VAFDHYKVKEKELRKELAEEEHPRDAFGQALAKARTAKWATAKPKKESGRKSPPVKGRETGEGGQRH